MAHAVDKREWGRMMDNKRRLMDRGMADVDLALSLEEDEAPVQEIAQSYRAAVANLEQVAALEDDERSRELLLHEIQGYENRAAMLEKGYAKPGRDRKISIQGYKGEMYTSKPNGRPSFAGAGQKKSEGNERSASDGLTSDVENDVRPGIKSRQVSRLRGPPKSIKMKDGLSAASLKVKSSGGSATLCCCGAISKSYIESIYDLCIKDIKEEYPSYLRYLGWILLITQMLVLTSYLYEAANTCVPKGDSYSPTVTWGIPLCCIYASADSLKEIFRYIPLLLYKEDPLISKQAYLMAFMVILLALYQMYAIGLIMSQTTNIITLISDFVGVTIVTKSDELIAEILAMEDIDPNFLQNLVVRAKLRALYVEDQEASGSDTPGTDVEVDLDPLGGAREAQAVRVGRKSTAGRTRSSIGAQVGSLTRGARTRVNKARGNLVHTALIQIGKTYKNPMKRLWWIASGAIIIGGVTATGRYFRYFCLATVQY
ncbi:unnamed protein product [Chrysoparadoxa australica]